MTNDSFILSQEAFNLLSSAQKKIIKLLKPITKKLNKEFISDKSGLIIDTDNQIVKVIIIPKDFPDAQLDIYFSKDQFILSYAESEQIEGHAEKSIDERLIANSLALIEKYLAGLLIIDYHNQNGKKTRREYYSKDGEFIAKIKYQYLFNKITREHREKVKNSSETKVNIKFY